MASRALVSSQTSRTLVNGFLKLLKNIALELRAEDVKTLTFLISDRLVISISPTFEGLDLISLLRENRLLSENNLDYFIELLDEIYRVDLGNWVREYQNTAVTTVKNAPQVQIEERLPALKMEFLYLVIPGRKTNITAKQIDDIKKSICEAIELRLSEVSYVSTDDDEESPLYSRVSFQLPEKGEKINKLQIDALNKKTWLTDLKIVELTVDNKSSIKLEEKKKDAAKQTRNGEKQPKQALPPRVQSVLALDPELEVHCNQTFDTILAIELSKAAATNTCQSVLAQCESAMKVFNQGNNDARLAVIRFGNHSTVPIRFSDQQRVAFVEKGLSNVLNFTSILRPEGCCGGNANSGIADALHVVHGFHDQMRRKATKLCILTCFISNDSADLEHYRSPIQHDDAIKLSHDLAMHAIPLYIIGINLHGGQSANQVEENYFLSGITAVTGGRYFQIQHVKHLKQLIQCIVKENNSIECNMGTVNDFVISEINKRYGDVNDIHLAKFLLDRLNSCACIIECTKQKGNPLKRISKISERVSWADDLDEAIDAVKRFKEHMGTAGGNLVSSPRPQQVMPHQTPVQTFTTVKQKPDLEVCGRMVRRQIERSAYYRPTTEKYMYP